MNENERKCPYCGHDKYRLVKDEITFSGDIYRKRCLKCGRKYD